MTKTIIWKDNESEPFSQKLFSQIKLSFVCDGYNQYAVEPVRTCTVSTPQMSVSNLTEIEVYWMYRQIISSPYIQFCEQVERGDDLQFISIDDFGYSDEIKISFLPDFEMIATTLAPKSEEFKFVKAIKQGEMMRMLWRFCLSGGSGGMVKSAS